jgi:hypothetical protein
MPSARKSKPGTKKHPYMRVLQEEVIKLLGER